ncbi:hypothetical protein [Actinocorallia libanotica]|uniref:Uncharacterized protein n=1 Tax=Actinocorallia libanotica TaxID=46162 RepID=A0ABP4CE49_9ACTN
MEVTVIVCDVCKRREVPAKRYTLSCDDGREVVFDRCTDDAGALEALLPNKQAAAPEASTSKQGEPVPPPAKPQVRTPDAKEAKKTKRRRGTARFATLDEIEAMKKKDA